MRLKINLKNAEVFFIGLRQFSCRLKRIRFNASRDVIFVVGIMRTRNEFKKKFQLVSVRNEREEVGLNFGSFSGIIIKTGEINFSQDYCAIRRLQLIRKCHLKCSQK